MSTRPGGDPSRLAVVNAKSTALFLAECAEATSTSPQPPGETPEDVSGMSQLFRVHKEPAADASVVELLLPDQLDDSDFDQLNESLLSMISESSKKWLIDLTQVSYMGSAMLGMMVNLRQQVKNAKGQIVLFGMSQRLADIFRTCCMERLFTIARSKTEALRLVK